MIKYHLYAQQEAEEVRRGKDTGCDWFNCALADLWPGDTPLFLLCLQGCLARSCNAKHGASLLQLAALCTDWRLTLYP